jgi:hypothetical protein
MRYVLMCPLAEGTGEFAARTCAGSVYYLRLRTMSGLHAARAEAQTKENQLLACLGRLS